MRIHGARVADQDARRLVASLIATNWPDARAAAFRIARGLDRKIPEVTLEPAERDAVLRALVDPPDALVDLRGALARDFRRRTSLPFSFPGSLALAAAITAGFRSLLAP